MNTSSERLSVIVEEASRILRYLNLDDPATNRRKEGQWTKKEILGHLIDSAINNYRRFVIGSTSETLTFSGYGQDGWVAAQNYDALSITSIVDLWYNLNNHIVRLVSNIPDDTLDFKHPEHNLHEIAFMDIKADDAEVSLRLFIEDYIDHIEHHLKQIIT